MWRPLIAATEARLWGGPQYGPRAMASHRLPTDRRTSLRDAVIAPAAGVTSMPSVEATPLSAKMPPALRRRGDVSPGPRPVCRAWFLGSGPPPMPIRFEIYRDGKRVTQFMPVAAMI